MLQYATVSKVEPTGAVWVVVAAYAPGRQFGPMEACFADPALGDRVVVGTLGDDDAAMVALGRVGG